MKIFVRGLPTETSPASLHAFAEQVLTPPWYMPLRRVIKIKQCVVLKIRDLELNTVEYHGLLEVTPYKAGVEAIERLKGQKFQGRKMLVRKWRERSGLNDQRQSVDAEGVTEGDRRTGHERRRPKLLIETYSPPNFQGLKQFHREFG